MALNMMENGLMVKDMEMGNINQLMVKNLMVNGFQTNKCDKCILYL